MENYFNVELLYESVKILGHGVGFGFACSVVLTFTSYTIGKCISLLKH